MLPIYEGIWAEMVQLLQAGHGDKAFEKFKEAIALAMINAEMERTSPSNHKRTK